MDGYRRFRVIELGIKAHVDHIRAAWVWDVSSRAGTLPNAGGEIVAHEFDYSKTIVVYNENGVKITSFPAIHIRDGSVSFRLDWNGLSFVFGGDSVPNKWFLKEAKNAADALPRWARVCPPKVRAMRLPLSWWN